MPKKDQERENEMQKCRVNYGVKENASGALTNNVLYLEGNLLANSKLLSRKKFPIFVALA